MAEPKLIVACPAFGRNRAKRIARAALKRGLYPAIVKGKWPAYTVEIYFTPKVP